MLGKASIPSLPSFLSHFLGKYKQESEWKIKDDAWEGNKVEEKEEGLNAWLLRIFNPRMHERSIFPKRKI